MLLTDGYTNASGETYFVSAFGSGDMSLVYAGFISCGGLL